jgi:hypothetical protein
MKQIIYFLLFFLSGSLLKANKPEQTISKNIQSTAISFTENKGQVADQFGKCNSAVLFSGNTGDMNYHLLNNGVSYQLAKVESWKDTRDPKTGKTKKTIDRSSTYRLDVKWLNANKNYTIQKGNAIEGYSNYYLAHCPDGITNVKSYKSIVYKNIYKGIDLKWYVNNGALEYDFIVNAGANVNDIKLEINGATILKDRSGNMQFKTPFGTISECKPKVYQNGKLLRSNWNVTGNVISFNVPSYNINLPLIIDPVLRTWGTYCGGVGAENSGYVSADATGNVYFTTTTNNGSTSSVFATVGAHQTTFGGSNDAVVSKFNSGGVRQWSTFYGGAGNENGSFSSADGLGNVVLVGSTSSSVGTTMATVGSHQSSFNGGSDDGFVVKFNSAGVRQWGTYYGGNGSDGAAYISLDLANNIYVSGNTTSIGTTEIATPGSHQTTFGGVNDGYLVKFNPSGVRQWGTYYGGSVGDYVYNSATEASGNVIMVGQTDSNVGTSIATAGSHQSVNGGLTDAFIVKFNTNGVRQWGTYYGGESGDYGFGCTFDVASNIYMVGVSSSTITGAIGTPGAFQTTYTPISDDSYIVKFNSVGVRQWGTYYGGAGMDQIYSCAIDPAGNLIVAGVSEAASSTGTLIATAGQYQSTYAGGSVDGFLAKFTNTGARVWGTYYGGAGDEYINYCAIDPNGLIYIAGTVNSTSTGTSIATAGSQQSLYGGGNADAFLAQLVDCQAFNINVTGKNFMCFNSTSTLTASGANSYTWQPGSLTGNTIIVTPLASTIYTVTGVIANTCTNSAAYSVTVVTPPTPTICMVTVDSVGQNNLILWDINQYGGVDSFFVYRDIAANNFQLIGKVPKTSTYGEFRDTVRSLYAANGDPKVSSWKYKIAIKDTCGNIGPKSLFHKTLFIQNSSGNFSWNDYQIEGQPIPVPILNNYIFRRDNNANGNWINIQTLSNSSNAYTDPNYATYVNTADWRVETYWTVNCNSSYLKTLAAVKKSKSNLSNNRMIGIKEFNLNNSIFLYPNPSDGKLTLQIENMLRNAEVVFANVLGQEVYIQTVTSGTNFIDLKNQAKGVYHYSILENKKRVAYGKIVIE